MADLGSQQFGNYRLLRLLGEGGFAQVYLGEHIHLGSLAAIKVLQNRLGEEDQEHFRREARTIVRLKHPNIVRLLDFGIEGSIPFLVMDYAPGGTLRQRHPRGQPLPLPVILLSVRQVADALQYAHDEKLIHRDVKPENMLVGERGEVLLSDFGIATAAQSSRSQSTQEVVGTAAYMAPEQFLGNPHAASDQYALGVVVYEWLTGTRPFHGSFLEISGQHLHRSPPPLREKLPSISPAVEQVVLTALAKDPQQRFASVRAFAGALEQAREPGQPAFQATSPASPLPPPPMTHPPSAPTRNISPPAERAAEQTPVVARHPLAAPLPTSSLPTLPARYTSERRLPPRGRGKALLALVLALVLLSGCIALILGTRPRAPASPSTSHSSGPFTAFTLPRSDSFPVGITAGPDGNLWFAEADGLRIGRISPAGTITEFPMPSNYSGQPREITAGQDGNLWFADDQIGRITPLGSVTLFSLSRPGTTAGITVGPDGNLWFTVDNDNRVGYIAVPFGGSQSQSVDIEFSVPTPDSVPTGITKGPDGNVWFTEEDGNKIGRITTGGNMTEFPVPSPNSRPQEITTGPDGNLWFTETDGNRIGRITPSGKITEFPVPESGVDPSTPSSLPYGITVGPDGNLWFTQENAKKLGRITPAGKITEVALPSSDYLMQEITLGPDGNLWLTEPGANKIVRFTPGK